MSFAALKQNRAVAQKKLMDELSKMNKSANNFSNDEENFWKPTVDKAGNGYAVIRFLPAPDGEDVPYVRYWDHGFQGPGGWYIEKSLTTLGQNDPVSEYNSELWNSGVEANKETARKQKRRLHYVSNIYVVHDPANPANNGKIFYFKYGKKIFNKINDLLKPEFEDETPINAFDFWSGANFKLKIRMVEGYRNYDKSEFDSPTVLASDEELEEIYRGIRSLNKFIDPSTFKTYDELKAKLHRVRGAAAGSTSTRVPTSVVNDDDDDDSAPWQSSNNSKVEEEDDYEEFFKKLNS